MTTPVRSPWIELASMLLGQDLYDWLRARREPESRFTPVSSWRLLTQELADATDGKVDISYQALRLFYRDAASIDGTPDDDDPDETDRAAS